MPSLTQFEVIKISLIRGSFNFYIQFYLIYRAKQCKSSPPKGLLSSSTELRTLREGRMSTRILISQRKKNNKVSNKVRKMNNKLYFQTIDAIDFLISLE